MKFLTAVAVYVVIGAVLATGIVMAAHGTYWLIILAAVIYLLLFAKFGCTAH